MSKKFKIVRFLSGDATRVRGEGGYKNVTFEGFLCSTVNDGENRYFTVDASGVALNSYSEKLIGKTSNLNFSLRHKNTYHEEVEINWQQYAREIISHYKCLENANATKKVEHDNVKLDVVEVTRYFRRWDIELDAWSNMGGMTVICELNYDTMNVKMYPAFCSNEENFSKSEGYAFALNRKNRNIGFQFKFDRNYSIRENLSIAVRSEDIIPAGGGSRLENENMYNELMKCAEQKDTRFGPIL